MKNPITEYFRLVRAIERAKREGRTDEFIRAAKENAELQKTMLRPKRYETINGAGEIGWGTAMLCFAFSSYSYVVLPASPWRNWVGWLFLLGACVAMPCCLWASKKFVTQPRVGYVAFRRDKSWWIGIVVGMVVAAVLGATLPFLMRSEIIHIAQSSGHHAGATVAGTPSVAGNIMKFSFGPMSALLYLMINAVSIKEHRWKWLVLILIAMVPAGINYFVPGNYAEVSKTMMLFLGAIWFVSGAVTLISFLRHHRPIAPDAE